MGRAFIAASILAALAVSTAAQVPLAAQEYTEDPATAQAQRLSPRELDSLLAPIALYPDQLLAPVLMAATYPRDVEAAADWTSTAVNASLNPDALAFALEPMEWDPSIKTLAQFPDVLRMLDDEWDWMVRVGNVFLLQETDVMDSIQRLRHQAYAAGQLRSTDVHRVRFENGAIVIEMVQPGTVYIPRYDPVRVYGAWSYPDDPPYYFHRPVTVNRYFVVSSLWGWSSWEWNRHRIRVDLPRYRYFSRHHPWRYNDDTWRHDRGRGRGIDDRRDGRRGDWRNNDRRGNDWHRNGRGGRPDGQWSGRRDGDEEGRERGRDGNGRRGDRRTDAAPNAIAVPPSGVLRGESSENRRRFGENQGRGEGRREFRGRQGQEAYAGPQLTPPGPIAPLPQEPRANRGERRRDLQPAGAFRGDPDQNRREFRANRGDGNRGFRRGDGSGNTGEDENRGRRGHNRNRDEPSPR